MYFISAVLVYLQGGVTVTESEGQARITAVKDGATERNVSVLVTIVMPTGNGMALATGEQVQVISDV